MYFWNVVSSPCTGQGKIYAIYILESILWRHMDCCDKFLHRTKENICCIYPIWLPVGRPEMLCEESVEDKEGGYMLHIS